MSSHPPQHHDGRHPTFKQYVLIATILFVITAIEFAIIVPQQLRGNPVSIPPLVILSALKFAIVVMFYMHLRFDSRTFTIVFVAGLALAFMVGAAVLGLFGSFQPTPRDFAAANAVPYTHEAEGAGPEPTPPQPEATQPPVGGQEPAPPSPPESGSPGELVAQGQAIFTGKGGCVACHTIEGVPGAVGTLGPELTHVGTAAADRKPDASAREYISESIQNPTAYLVEGFQPLMPTGLADQMAPSEFEALVEFLLAQK